MDVGQRRGTYPREVPFTPGMEAADLVESVGDGVGWAEPGDRFAYTEGPGGYAEASLVRADRSGSRPNFISTREE